jgi:hypothetical protein
VGNDGVDGSDRLGQKCNDTFDLSDNLVSTLNKAWSDSFNQDKTVAEQGGDIVNDASGKQISRQGEHGNDPNKYDHPANPKLADGETRVGTFHTHPYEDSKLNNTTFSGEDIEKLIEGRLGDLVVVMGGDCIFILVVDNREAANKCTWCKKKYEAGYQSDPDASFQDAAENGVKRAIRGCGICYYKACKKNGKFPTTADLQNKNDHVAE